MPRATANQTLIELHRSPELLEAQRDLAVADTYAAMIRYMERHYCTTASRYTTSVFLRLKLGEALSRRRVAPHIFETAAEAQAVVDGSRGA